MIDEPDKIWKLTPVGRSLVDLENMASRPPYETFFRSPDTLKNLHQEQQRLAKTMNAAYLITAALAFFILLGTTSQEAKVSLFGIEAPVNLLPQQAMSIIMAGIFGYYATQFLSFLMLSLSIQKILSLEKVDSWQFFSAPFDASTLWAVAISPKTVGYRSPRRVALISIMVLIVSAGTVLAQSAVVFIASIYSALAAWNAGGIVNIALGFGSALIVGTSIVGVLLAALWKVPYKLHEDIASTNSPPSKD